MHEQTVLKASSSADFLAALPQLAGFTANNSCFIVLFEGNRSIGAARIDTPTTGHESDDELMRWFLAVHELCTRSESVALVFTTSGPLGDAASNSDARTLTTKTHRFLEKQNIKLKDLCVIAGDGWASFIGETDPITRPLTEIRNSALASPVELPDVAQWRTQHHQQPHPMDEIIKQRTAQMATA